MRRRKVPVPITVKPIIIRIVVCVSHVCESHVHLTTEPCKSDQPYNRKLYARREDLTEIIRLRLGTCTIS